MKKKKLLVRIIVIALVLIVGASSVFIIQFTGKSKVFQVEASENKPEYRSGLKAVSNKTDSVYTVENDILLMKVDEKEYTVSVTDKRTGKAWESFYDASKLDNEPNTLWEQNIKALISFSYVDSTKKSNDVLSKNNLSEKNTTVIEKIENGVSINFNFGIIKIKISLNLQIVGDELIVSIPESSISEDNAYKLVSVTPLPFFGSSSDTDNGYFFYPNGPGEIFNFKSIKNRENSVKQYSLPIYSEFAIDLETRNNISEFDKEENKIMLPVFGVKNGNDGFVAIIEQGDKNAMINIVPGGVSVSANRINTTFSYRNDYSVASVGLSASGGTTNSPLAQMYDKEIISGDRSISYRFLTGENSDYCGMARSTRENFIARGLLSEKTEDTEMPLMLDLFMGVVENKMIFDEYITMTTGEQAKEIVSYLAENGIKNANVNLMGLSKSGYNNYSVNTPLSSKITSGKVLKELAELCHSNNYKLFAEASFVNIKKGSTKYSAFADPAKDQNSFVYSDYNEDYFLFNPYSTYYNATDYLSFIKKYDIDGVMFEDFGDAIYNDFSKSGLSKRENTAALYNKILDNSKEQLGLAGTVGGNAYLLNKASFLKNIPNESSNVLFSDETVPFYQMVVHGSTNYTNVPINLFYDKNQQLLKLVEYGYIPYFELTYEPSFYLKDTDSNELFNSRFENWKDDVVKIYDSMKTDFSDVYNQQMVKHTKISDSVYLTEYKNGVKVYVNYNKTDYNIGDLSISAENYLVVR